MAPPPPPRRPPDLMPELVGEILVCFPPDDPASLARASAVCKTWRRLLCDPAFRRRYAAFHCRASQPLLGYLHNCSIHVHRKYYYAVYRAPCFVSTTTPSPVQPLQPFDDYNYAWRVLDYRHGRILFAGPGINRAVWDRATGKHEKVPRTPSPRPGFSTVAVLCAVRGCDHLDCHGGPFLFVFVGINSMTNVVQSHVYSSETSDWRSSSFQGGSFVTTYIHIPSVVVGDDIYFVLASHLGVVRVAILKIDLGENQLSIIDPPSEAHHLEGNAAFLMATEHGSLGFAHILGSTLRLWSRNVMGSEVLGGWAACRVIELQTLIPFKNRLRVVGSAEGSGIIFLDSDVGVFTLDLKSGRQKKVDEPRKAKDIVTIFPFMGFYTPDGSSSKLRLPMHEATVIIVDQGK